jgi:glutamine synthetase
MKILVEYVWLDGHKPEPNLRSKVRVITMNFKDEYEDKVPDWSFDGSSTMQAEGYSSDCYLKPVKFYSTQFGERVYALCEVYNKDGNPHETNDRHKLGEEDRNLWVGFEQEYFIRSGHNKPILGFENGGIIDAQGKYYCGVGGQIVGRELSDKHLIMCLSYGINVEGTNAEVALGQWEYQIFAKGKKDASDDLWMSRYFLFKLTESYKYQIELHPKPIMSNGWNGSGLHTNFSNKRMREEGGEEYFKSIFRVFESNAKSHIENYGSDNHLRLTGKYETQSIDKFSWGISDRGASIRVPKSVGETWKGYLEDRRPASNANPYKIMLSISNSLKLAEELDNTLHNMYNDIDITKSSEKFNGILSNEDIIKDYLNDDDYQLTDEFMESKANIQTEVINFNINHK